MARSTKVESSDHVAHTTVSTPLPGVLLTAAARELLERVGERTRKMIDTRFGLTDGRPHTLAEIGEPESISRERVRQIIEVGFDLLRRDDTEASKNVLLARSALLERFRACGGVALEEHLLTGEAGRENERAALRLLLFTFPEFQEARDTQRTHAHWVNLSPSSQSPLGPKQTESTPLETVLEAAEHLLEAAGTVIHQDQFLKSLSASVGETFPAAVLQSFLAISKRVVRTPFGDYGLVEWREASPRSVGDKAYIVLRSQGKPLHFRSLAEEINRAGFDRKQALPETVHNDVIRDKRFVLVGRGLYALREWGFTPGRVSEVIVRLLQSAGRPLPRAEIVTAVLKERFVKRNTVLLSLLNQDLFRALPDGRYVLAATPPVVAAAAPAGSESAESPSAPPP